MLVSYNVDVKINSSNYNYFFKKGYSNFKCGDILTVKVSDLSKGSHTKIKLICDHCKKEKIIKYNVVNKYYDIYKEYKCRDCKRKENLLKEKGVENVFQLKEIKEKIKNTIREKYKVDNISKSEYFQEKKKKTNKDRYGKDWCLSNKDIYNKVLKTVKERYHVDNISQLEYIKDKKIETCINNYGEFFFKYTPKYNPISIIEFDLLSEFFNIEIKHALNGGEKKFNKYSVDGYIEKYNIILEWDEEYHNYQKENDMKRQLFIENNFNCKFIRINQKEWLNNKRDENYKIFYGLFK